MQLLLLADPSEDKIRASLAGSRCFLAEEASIAVGACVVQPRGGRTHELMSIAISADHQQQGLGTRLLAAVIKAIGDAGARRLEVGAGTFGHQLAFYQRRGFRVTRIDHDLFVKRYPAPIFEHGIQHFDMLRLTLEYGGKTPDVLPGPT